MKYLILFLLPLTLFARKEDVSASKAEIVNRLLKVDASIVEIDQRSLEIPVEMQGIQDMINTKSDERDALPEGDPLAKEIQKEIDDLVLIRESLVIEIDVLALGKIGKLDKKRQLLWIQRARALPDLRLAMQKAGLNQPNMKVFIKEFVKAKDETKLLAIEAVTAQVQEDLDAVEERKQKLIDAKVAIKAVDPLTITQGDAVRLLKNVIILLQGM